jgi:hypothetical protein
LFSTRFRRKLDLHIFGHIIVIGVLAKDSETRVVSEFFQLFKTPWEFYDPENTYDAVVATCYELPQFLNTQILLIYSSQSVSSDARVALTAEPRKGGDWLEWHGTEIPIYGDLAAFASAGQPLLKTKRTDVVVGSSIEGPPCLTVRVGYDLFSEVAFLLSAGQPPENGHIPTLDLHISLLRTIIVNAGAPLVEIPPVPAGYDFMACLTHDVDFVGVRDHKWDHTMWGFLYRCLVGSFVKALKGKLTWSKCMVNWKAAITLPLVHMGLRDDFWLEFDRYVEIERGLGSTFFFIPFKNAPGGLERGQAPKRRAARYDVAQIQETLRHLVESGCEVGVHGIDAWRDAASAASEFGKIQQSSGVSELGIRMHWLYWRTSSSQCLAATGFAYDSTFGFNHAIGFRAGTTQPFCFVGTENLLELPLNIQDTAMFYSDRMELSESDALAACKGLIGSSLLFGGVLTVNWHTRSLSPERQWGDFYMNLLEELHTHRVRFGTAAEIVKWFRQRRRLQFESVRFDGDCVFVNLAGESSVPTTPFNLRVYHRCSTPKNLAVPDSVLHTEVVCNGKATVEIPCAELVQ